MTSATELHLLFILLDSNLPTGGFVSSSGLESWAKHGFLSSPTYNPSPAAPGPTPSAVPSLTATAAPGLTASAAPGLAAAASTSRAVASARPSQVEVVNALTEFARAEVENYARTTACFVRDAWEVMGRYLDESRVCGVCGKLRGNGTSIRSGEGSGEYNRNGDGDSHGDDNGNGDGHGNYVIPGSKSKGYDGKASGGRGRKMGEDDVVSLLVELDKYHESTMLSHVSRRSSKAQGIAMLTLYSRGLSRPVAGLGRGARVGPGNGMDRNGIDSDRNVETRDDTARAVLEVFKRCIRAAKSPGHLAVCWGVMCASLGLSLARTVHLHLFLHARSLLSSAVRLNLIGPYASSQLLLHPFEGIIHGNVQASVDGTGTTDCRCRRRFVFPTKPDHRDGGMEGEDGDTAQQEAEEQGDEAEQAEEDIWAWAVHADSGPATTWPLGEILMARHDLQHSRIFNS